MKKPPRVAKRRGQKSELTAFDAKNRAEIGGVQAGSVPVTPIVAKCVDCRGRGWVLVAKNEWPDACPMCEGTGNLSRARLASLFSRGADYANENRELYYRAIEAVQEMRPTRRRGIIVLARIAKLFPEALHPRTMALYS